MMMKMRQMYSFLDIIPDVPEDSHPPRNTFTMLWITVAALPVTLLLLLLGLHLLLKLKGTAIVSN